MINNSESISQDNSNFSDEVVAKRNSLLTKQALLQQVCNLPNHSDGQRDNTITECDASSRNTPLTEKIPLTVQDASLRNGISSENANDSQSKHSTIKDKPLSYDELKTLNLLNEKYAHVTVGGKHKVVSTKPCPVDGKSLHIESLSEFKNYFLSEPKIAGLNTGEAWLAWQGKVFKPDGISFYPNPELCPPTIYNLFEGFAISPKQGDVSLFINHVFEVICNGDQVAAEYLIGFFAHMIQKPDEKPSVAIVMKSIEGTGKGTLLEPLMRILGALAVQVNGAYQLSGRFNSVVANKLLVFADEVDLTDPRTADKLKGMISEPRLSMERKGIDPIQVPNFCRFIFASNHETVIKAGNRERRYLVLEPSGRFAQNTEYFKKLWQWINANGGNYLFDYFLNYDLSNFDPRKAPVTAALLEEKKANLTPYQEFMFGELNQERPFDGMCRIETQQMTKKCFHWLEVNKYQMTEPRVRSGIGKLLNQIGIIAVGKSGRGAYYELPELRILQEKFSSLLGHSPNEIFD